MRNLIVLVVALFICLLLCACSDSVEDKLARTNRSIEDLLDLMDDTQREIDDLERRFDRIQDLSDMLGG